MSRERTDKHSERGGSEPSRRESSRDDQSHQAESGTGTPPRPTPTKAEGELTDIEQALENEKA